jgi:hypothetical protein
MLVTFKSAASADVIMFGDAAQAMIEILGKDPSEAKGIVTVEQLPDAIARLKTAIDEDKMRQTLPNPDQEEADAEEGKVGMAEPVNLAQRAWPLLDLLEDALKERVPVVWGV